MKNYLLAGLAIAALAAPTMAVATAPAAAAPIAVQARDNCSGKTIVAETDLKIRKSTSTKSAALGTFPKGKKAKCLQDYVPGGTYSACGGGTLWTQIDYGPEPTGYVALFCTKFA